MVQYEVALPIGMPMRYGADAALTALSAETLRPQAARTALAIGTVGRVGEELINCLLESPAYASLNLAVQAPLRSVLPGLRPWPVKPGALDAPYRSGTEIALPRVDDVFCCVGGTRSYFGRDRAYVPVRADQVPALARMAANSGARRFVLLSPLSAFLQLSAPAGAALHVREIDLVALGFETLVILRPTADYAAASGHLIERLVGWGAKAIMEILIPQRLQPPRARQIAQAAIRAAIMLEPGMHIINGRQITELAAGVSQAVWF